MVLVDHNVDADFPLGVVVEVLDHHVNEIQNSSDRNSALRHSNLSINYWYPSLKLLDTMYLDPDPGAKISVLVPYLY